MIGKLFAGTAMKVAAGIIAALVLALGIQSWRLSNAQDARDEALANFAVCEDRHAATRGSVLLLETKMAGLLERAEKRNAEYRAAEERFKRDRKRLADAAGRTDRQIADLLATDVPESGCAAPEAVLEAMEGL